MGGEKEEEADNFARDKLVPRAKYREFVSKPKIWLPDIELFANEIGIAPGIVVGRLQHDGLLPVTHGNKLKVYYRWVEY